MTDKISFLIFLSILPFFVNAQELAPCPDNIVSFIGKYPEYPTGTSRPVEGWVKFEAILTPEGKLSKVKILDYEPSKMFNRSILESLKTWEFSWRGSTCRYTHTFEFRIEK